MKKLVLFFTLLFSAVSEINAQAFEWAKIQGMEAPAIATDGTNLYSAANIMSAVTLGNQTFVKTGIASSYLAKQDQQGSYLWAKHIVGAGKAINVQTDFEKNIIVTGMYWDSLHVGNLLFKNPILSSQWGGTYTNLFIIKFNPAGSVLWARTSNVLPGWWPNNSSISTDSNGNIYLSATFSNSITFNNSTVSAIGDEDIFLVKYDKSGTFQWLKSAGGAYYDQWPLIQCGNNNEVYLKYLTHQGSGTGLQFTLKKFNGTGTLEWTKVVNNAYADGLTADDNGNIYLSGSGNTTLAFDNISLPIPTGTNHLYLAKITPAGTWKWAKNVIQGNYNGSTAKLGNKLNNSFSISGQVLGSPVIGNTTFNTVNLTRPETFIAKADTAGNISRAAIIRTEGVIFHNGFENQLITDSLGFTYYAGGFGGLGMPMNGSVFLGPHILNPGKTQWNSVSFLWESTGFVTKILDNANEVTGTLFIDANGNGLKDTGEKPFNNGIVGITPNSIFITSDSTGLYKTYLASGTYNLQVHQPTNHYTFIPQTHSVSFSGLGQTQTKNFALVPIQNRNDVKISVTNITPVRPGFELKYLITYENVGTTSLSDSISFRYNANHLTFIRASVSPAQQQAGKLNWFYQPLAPTQKRTIEVKFTVSASTAINTNLNAIAVIKPLTTDFIASNNYDTLKHAVTGSYDPNDKQVRFTKLTPAQVANGKLLDYVIRFKNTGNDTAFTVIVRDSISSNLHMPSFELLSASHPYTFRLLENGMVEWRFDNIKLVDSTRNERGSHGFIRYRMQPKTNLVLGDVIKSRAAIYFDYNVPVMTNYAVTKVSNITGLRKDNSGLQAFELYPNPAKNYVMVAAELRKQTAATVILKNLLGQTISEVMLPANNQVHYQMPLNNLPKGVYIVQFETEMGRQTQRLVVQ